MKTISPKRTWGKPLKARKILLIAVVSSGLIFIVAGSIYALEKTRTTDFIKDPFYVSDQERAEESTKNDPTSGGKGGTAGVDGVDSSKNINDIPKSTNMSIVILSTSQTLGVVTSRVSITNSKGEGVCSFTFSKNNSKPVVRSVTTLDDTCEVSIPEQEFGMVGLWHLSVHYFANNTQTETTGSITIR